MYRWYVFKWFNNKVVETTILNTLFMLLVLDSQGPTVQWTVVMRLIVHEGADVTNYQPAAGTASLTLPKANIILIFIQFCSSSPCACANTMFKWYAPHPHTPYKREHLVICTFIIPFSNWHALRVNLISICHTF